MRVSVTSLAITACAVLVSADQCTQQPAGYDPTAGILAISSPDTTSPVTAGSQATITWQKLASTASTVSINLCKGPSTNCVPILCITNDASNDAQSFTWNVPSDLTASGSSGGYGLKIIENGSGRFQYSTQFGVLNNNVESSSASTTPESPVTQITDGQVQVPTSTGALSQAGSTLAPSLPKYTVASGSPKVPFPTGTAFSGYSLPAPTGKVSNTTHSSGYVFSYGPNTAPNAGVVQNGTFTQTATAVPSIFVSGSGAPGTGASSTQSAPITPATGAAQKVVAGGVFAGLGAMAVLVL